jgi:quercetin dioxygenase-like cupin family protein
VLEGEIVLELDDGRETTLRTGDTAVQNGTRQRLRTAAEDCWLLVVMAAQSALPDNVSP